MKYAVGTVSMTNGSAVVTGAGTKWAANVSGGQIFTVAGSGVPYYIGSVDSDTQITLTSNWIGTTTPGLGYTIVQSFTPNFNIPYPDIGDVQTATILKRALLMIDTIMLSNTPGSLTIGFPTNPPVTGITGTLLMKGATSGTVTIQPQDTAGTYNFNLPTTAGSSDQPLVSGGGGTTAMSWGAISGTGSFAKTISPVFTGTLAAASITASATIAATGAITGASVTATGAVAGASLSAGSALLNGSSSGTVTVAVQAAAGTFNFNLPTTAGASGAPLLSGGGGTAAMTWGTVSGAGAFALVASPTFTGTVAAAAVTLSGTLTGVAGTFSGSVTAVNLKVTGSSSGTITIAPQAAAGTYNFNLPTTAGTSGTPLLSGGGGGSAMTWGTVTGSGAFALAGSPTFTGTLAAAAITASGTITGGALTTAGTLTAGAAIISGLLNLTGAAAGQIAFPAIANPSVDPNTLDDYEEGTWTPSWVPATSGTITLNINTANYLKIGRLVTLGFYNVVGAISSPNGTNFSITGVPFPGYNVANNYTAGAIGGWRFTLAAGYTSVGVESSPGLSTLIPICNGSGNPPIAITAATVAVGSTLIGSVTFLSDT